MSEALTTPSGQEQAARQAAAGRLGELFGAAPETAPTFFVVGAMKAGTTMLASLLRGHPGIFLAPIKEPTFFCTDINARPPVAPMPELDDAGAIERHAAASRAELGHFAIVRDAAVYRALFATARGYAARGECSTAYLYSEAAPARIARELPAARIVVVLRSPVRRAFSEYLMNRSIGRTSLSFVECLRAEPLDLPITHGQGLYVRAGRYADQLERFLACFPRRQLHVLIFEELLDHLEDGFGELCDFLAVERLATLPDAGEKNSAMVSRFDGLNRLLYASNAKALISRLVPRRLKELGKSVYYRPPVEQTMTAEERGFLERELSGDVRRLELLIGRDLRAVWSL
jgi:hypothetical protein